MGTLLGGTTGLCVLASLLVSVKSASGFIDSRPPLRATSSSVAPSVSDELRVIETRAISDEQGLLIYGNTSMRDSMIVAARVLRHLTVGDIVSDYEGTIDR